MSNLALSVVSDNFEHYMTQVNRFQLLTPEQEVNLARRFRDHDDLEAAESLVTANLRFVVKVAYEYRTYGCKMLDLVQEGNIGLMLAVKKFDPERGVRLISYAVWWIRAYIQNFIVKSWSLVKIGTTQAQKKLFFKLNQTREALKRLTGDHASEDIAAELDVRTAEVEEMSQRMKARDASLDLQLVEGDDYSLMDSLADDRANQEELLAEQQEDEQRKEQIATAMDRLNPREREIVAARLLRDTPQTLQELADRYGISRERVRQVEQNALKKMKEALQCRNPLTAG